MLPILVLRRQRKVDPCEFGDSLVYITRSKLARATYSKTLSQNKTNKYPHFAA